MSDVMRIMRNMTGKKHQLLLYRICLMRHAETLCRLYICTPNLVWVISGIIILDDRGRPGFIVIDCQRQFQCNCLQGKFQIFLQGLHITCNYGFTLVYVIVCSSHLSGVSIMTVVSYDRECVLVFTSLAECF